mgnify:CR=1 FL=1
MQEQLTPDFGDYELLDTGDFEKLERFGRYVTVSYTHLTLPTSDLV